MKYSIILLLTVLFSVCHGQTTDKDLFRIFENGKTGFMNANGEVVIKPTFLVAGPFSEGLANARTNGTYGYIDPTGNFAIQPQFDYATPFHEGLAIIYKDGQAFFINKQGQKPFEMNFPGFERFENGKAIVYTATDKSGMIDTHGKLIIDTVFASIYPFINGFAVVVGLNHSPYADSKNGIEKKYETGVIDTLGQFVIPYGKYEDIYEFENGYFRAEIPAEPWDTIDGYSQQTVFLDESGKLIFATNNKNHSHIDGGIYCGLARMSLYKYWISEEEGYLWSSEKSYSGFIDLHGEIVINDTTYQTANSFADNRAFIRSHDRNYFIIDTKGKIISEDRFPEIIGEGFKNGVAFVKKGEKYGMIDTNAVFLIEPKFEGIDEVGFIHDYFFFYNWSNGGNRNYDRLYGVAKKDGSILLYPMMQEFDRNGFQNGLLCCLVNNKTTYINEEGKNFWQESDNTSKQLKNVHIDFMNRGYFYGYTEFHEKLYGSSNIDPESIAKKIPKSQKFPGKTLSVMVHPEMTDTIYGSYNALTVFVANNSKEKIDFNAQDHRLKMKVQAKNANGEWKDIEYLPSSWCGNSYHTLTLDPQNYWTFLTPLYEGDIKTKLRVELTYIDPDDKSKEDQEKKELTVYSNEYEGSINPAQFWRKEGYSPIGIMDPYND